MTNNLHNFFDTNPEDYLEYGFCFRSDSLSRGRAHRQARQELQPKKEQIYQETDDRFYFCSRIRRFGAALIVFSLLLSFQLNAALLKADRALFLPLVYVPAVIGALVYPVTHWCEKRYIRQQRKNMENLLFAEAEATWHRYWKQRNDAGVPANVIHIDVLHSEEWREEYDGMMFSNTELAAWRQNDFLCLMDDTKDLIWKIPIREIHEAGLVKQRVGLQNWYKGHGPCRGWVRMERWQERPIVTDKTPYEVYGLECDACRHVFLPSYNQLEIHYAEKTFVLLIPCYDIDALRCIL